MSIPDPDPILTPPTAKQTPVQATIDELFKSIAMRIDLLEQIFKRSTMDDDMMEEVEEALNDAICDGEGRLTKYYIRNHLLKRGFRIIRVEPLSRDQINVIFG